MRNISELANSVRDRPLMYGRGATFNDFVALVNGFCLGQIPYPLEGFQQWLAARLGHGTNLDWSVLVLRIASQAADKAADELSDTELVGCAVDLIDEFLMIPARDRDALTRVESVLEAETLMTLNGQLRDLIAEVAVRLGVDEGEVWGIYLAVAGRVMFTLVNSWPPRGGVKSLVLNDWPHDGQTRHELWRSVLEEVVGLLGEEKVLAATGRSAREVRNIIGQFFGD